MQGQTTEETNDCRPRSQTPTSRYAGGRFETLMDRSFPQSKARHAVSCAVDGKATLDFSVWEGTIVALQVAPRHTGCETGMSYSTIHCNTWMVTQAF